MTRAENKEQYKKYDKTYYMKHRRPKTKIGQAEQRIADLEAKLVESEKRISKLKEANNTFSFISDCIPKYLDKREFTFKDIEDFFKSFEQLKQQLKAKEHTINTLIDDYKANQKWYKIQLAEKEADISLARNEINTLKHNLKIAQEHDNVMCEQYFKKCKETKQDKISFAVEKLKETKIYVDNQHFMNARYKCEKKVYADIWNYIDNQIEELKKEMK